MMLDIHWEVGLSGIEDRVTSHQGRSLCDGWKSCSCFAIINQNVVGIMLRVRFLSSTYSENGKSTGHQCLIKSGVG